MSVIGEIVAERHRQIESEKYQGAHDDALDDGALARAAACYAAVGGEGEYMRSFVPPGTPPSLWPWSPKAWKPKNPRRDLIRAAALIVAEIERMDRKVAG